MEKSYPVAMSDYEVYRCCWCIRHHEECTKYPTTGYCFLKEIREKRQDGTLGKMCPVRPLQVNDFLKKNQRFVWYQYDIYLEAQRLLGLFYFGATGSNKMMYQKWLKISIRSHWKKKERKGEINTADVRGWVQWGGNSTRVCIVGIASFTFKQKKTVD